MLVCEQGESQVMHFLEYGVRGGHVAANGHDADAALGQAVQAISKELRLLCATDSVIARIKAENDVALAETIIESPRIAGVVESLKTRRDIADGKLHCRLGNGWLRENYRSLRR